jgi:uncharacterized membrane protein HdeD (DUF308 family)
MSTTPHPTPQTIPAQPQPPRADMIRAGVARMAGPWWMFLLTGIAWLVISFVVLRFTTASAVTVGVLIGVVFVVAMANEFMIASVARSWRWAHAVMGALFLAGAVWAFISPFNAFWALASAIGVLFILQGALVLISSLESRPVNSAWWLGVIAGSLEILLGFWASQQVVPARALLLILFVGFWALFRGISEIVFSFELKVAQKA